MAKCAICKTAWTTQGMSLCPICGARVEGETEGETRIKAREPESTRVARFVEIGADKESRSNGSAVIAAAPEMPKTELRPMPAEAHLRSEIPVAATVPTPLFQDSVVLPAPKPGTGERRLPSPSRPLSAPLVLGFLALVPGAFLPASVLLESHRIFGILGFCATAFFVPFGPIAWLVGLSAEKRRREQGLRPEARVVLGRMLGQFGTLVLSVEVTVVLLLIAGLRLAGKLPLSFQSQTF